MHTRKDTLKDNKNHEQIKIFEGLDGNNVFLKLIILYSPLNNVYGKYTYIFYLLYSFFTVKHHIFLKFSISIITMLTNSP